MYILRVATVISILLLSGHANACENGSIKISSGEWRPYITDEFISEWQRVASGLVMLEGYCPKWSFPGFDFALELLKNNHSDLSFPYFKTEKRLEKFTFSEPVFHSKNVLIYNRLNTKLNDGADVINDSKNYIIGGVSGYSYENIFGKNFIPNINFLNERDAVYSLISGEVEFLPMSESVFNNIVLDYFAEHIHALRVVPNIEWFESLHFVSSKDEKGQLLIKEVNRSITNHPMAGLENSSDQQLNVLAESKGRGTVTLNPSKIDPVVRGRRDGVTYYIPSGSVAIVIEWGESFFNYNKGKTTVYELQNDESLILIINGPHSGKKFYVKNSSIGLL